MFDLLLRRARLADDTLTDIAIQDGKIAALGEIDAPAHKTVELNGDVFVSAGWIDSHVHCYPNSPIYHDEPDSVGIATGVTSVVDAGSTGADDVDDFYDDHPQGLHRGVCPAEHLPRGADCPERAGQHGEYRRRRGEAGGEAPP